MAEKNRTCSRVRQQSDVEFLIPAGTNCMVRKLGSKEWTEYVSKADVVTYGFLWRNEYCYGFLVEDWEVKVNNGDWCCALRPDTPSF